MRYRVILPNVTESPQTHESPVDYAVRMAIEKTRSGLNRLQAENQPSQPLPILGADTVVSLNNRIMGKPKSKAEGLAMLADLSGKSHDVISAVTLITTTEGKQPVENTTVNKSTVTFREITNEEREHYWKTNEPQDKAGGYAIQGVAAMFISHLSGSYSSVMGLPLLETATMLRQSGIKII